MEEGTSDTQEWYIYKIGDRSFVKLGDTTSHPEELKTATHVRIEACTIANNAFFRFQALVAVDLLVGLEIGERAFQYCSNLQFVSMPSTLRVIGQRAFQACSSLEMITIPKTTTVIGPGAFCNCSALTVINLPKDGSLEVLEDFVLSGCSELRLIHVPASVKHIRKGAFLGCLQLVTIEFPLSILSLGKECFSDAFELANVIIPTTLNCIEDDLFDGAYTIRQAVLEPNSGEEDNEVEEDEEDEGSNIALVNALMKRCDGLPLHKLCYYHTYSPIETTLNDIQKHIRDCDQIDMFGMTPIHVLALSTVPSVRIFQELAKFIPPNIFTAVDKSNMRPIDYLINSSMSDAKESIKFMIHHTIVDRSQWLGLDVWKCEIANQVDALDHGHRGNLQDQICTLYTSLEKLELVESTSLVEMALWNIWVDEAKKAISSTNIDREACRISCGADTVIRNVLEFII